MQLLEPQFKLTDLYVNNFVFFTRTAIILGYEKSKIDPKVQSRLFRRGLQTAIDEIRGLTYSKKTNFRAEIWICMPKIKAFTSGWIPCSSHYWAKLCKEKINISILADELKINYTSQVCIPSNEHSGEVAQLRFKNRPDLQNRLPPHIYCHQHRVLVNLFKDYWDDDWWFLIQRDKKNFVSYFQITFYPH